MSFDNDLKPMRDSYYEIERRFIEISRIIPLENPPETYSPRLYEILQTSCGQVENLLRLICDKLQLTYANNNFPAYYQALNSTGILVSQGIDYFSGNLICMPFTIVAGNSTPFWWKAYNDTKHGLPEGYKQGNLKNTINSLAAVYALHCIGAYVQNFGDDVMKISQWHQRSSISMNTLRPVTEFEWHIDKVRPKSDIFYPISYFREL